MPPRQLPLYRSHDPDRDFKSKLNWTPGNLSTDLEARIGLSAGPRLYHADSEVGLNTSPTIEHAGVDSLAGLAVHLGREDPVRRLLSLGPRQVELAEVRHVEQSSSRPGGQTLRTDLNT